MSKPILDEQFSDNGEHSHWHLTNEYGQVLWSSFPEETRARGQKIRSEESAVITDQDKQLSLLRGENAKLREALERIKNQEEYIGREGCTYLDTVYDSISAQQGFNDALKICQEIAAAALSTLQGETKDGESLLTNNK